MQRLWEEFLLWPAAYKHACMVIFGELVDYDAGIEAADGGDDLW